MAEYGGEAYDLGGLVLPPTPPTSQDIILTGVKQDRDRCLGVGSYGAVYRGRWCGTPVAVKCLHRVLDIITVGDAQPACSQRFQDEMRTLQELKHPNICQLIGIAENPDGTFGMVIELLECTLKQRYEEIPRLEVHEHIAVTKCIVAGLCYLHDESNRIVHRDLTTSNVMFTDRRGSHVKICDVGGARKMLQGRKEQPMTLCPGAQSYMAPEALLEMTSDNAVYGPPADIYALGICLATMLVRKEPNIYAKSRRSSDLLLIQQSGHPLAQLISQCQSERPGDRPSALEACSILDEIKVIGVQQRSGAAPTDSAVLRAELIEQSECASLRIALEESRRGNLDLRRDRFEMEEKLRASMQDLDLARQAENRLQAGNEKLTALVNCLGRELEDEKREVCEAHTQLAELEGVREVVTSLQLEKNELTNRVSYLERQLVPRTSAPKCLPYKTQDALVMNASQAGFDVSRQRSSSLEPPLQVSPMKVITSVPAGPYCPRPLALSLANKWQTVGEFPDGTSLCSWAGLHNGLILCPLTVRGSPSLYASRVGNLTQWETMQHYDNSWRGSHFFSYGAELHCISWSPSQPPRIAKLDGGYWVNVAKFNFSRERYGCLLLDDQLIIAGGVSCDTRAPVYEVEIFCFATQRVRRLPDLHFKVSYPRLCSLGTDILILGSDGGCHEPADGLDVLSLDTSRSASVWRCDKYPRVPFGKCGAATVGKDMVVVAGGRQSINKREVVNCVFCLRPNLDGELEWIPLPSMAASCQLPSILYDKDQSSLFILGGDVPLSNSSGWAPVKQIQKLQLNR